MWGTGESVSSEGIYPESMISCPKPYGKIAAAREGGREGWREEGGRENDLVSPKKTKSSSERRKKQTEGPADVGPGKQAGQGSGC